MGSRRGYIIMLKKVVIAILLIGFLSLEVLGQTFPREYWKEIVDASKVIIVGTVEEEYRVIRPEKFKPNPDGSSPSDMEIYVGMVFRVKVTKKLKGKIKTEKVGEGKYTNIFLYGTNGIPGLGDPKIFKGKEYVLFLEPNNDEELEGKETIEFKPNNEIITKPFDYKSSYVVVEGFRGAVEIKSDKDKLIKEIKDSF